MEYLDALLHGPKVGIPGPSECAGYESAVNVATAALHMHYFGPVPKTHKPYTYKDFVVCLKTNMLNHQIHEYAQFLRPLPEQDPTNCALIMAEASIGMVGEVFQLRNATEFHRRWVACTGGNSDAMENGQTEATNAYQAPLFLP